VARIACGQDEWVGQLDVVTERGPGRRRQALGQDGEKGARHEG
jgi:hypothetical protein